jgi:cardiolipin synthase
MLAHLYWPVVVLATVGATYAAAHALLNKRDPRAAWGWIAVCLMFPLAGALLYALFGINRVTTRGGKLQKRAPFDLHDKLALADVGCAKTCPPIPEEFRVQARSSYAVTGRPLVGGNRVDILHNGEQAYPAMLDAINQAKRSIYLTTYIFETNRTGRIFINALHDAVQRGVDVRVIVDGIGEFTQLPLATWLLHRKNVPCARFLPPRLFPLSIYVNLRTHHKLLVVDSELGFAGGMNIGDRHMTADTSNPKRVADVHFRLQGPIASQMEEIFLWDWGFVTGEETEPPEPILFPYGGDSICRTVPDGPNEDLDKLLVILEAAVSSARERIWIMTPYFLPPRPLLAALSAAAIRGVEVTVILPEKSDSRMVDYATKNSLWELLERGVRIVFQPPPFVHSKLFLVDRHYSLVGSANFDPRSLRLNFEFAVEIYDTRVNAALAEYCERAASSGREASVEALKNRSLPVRLRDAFCWLFSPYL